MIAERLVALTAAVGRWPGQDYEYRLYAQTPLDRWVW